MHHRVQEDDHPYIRRNPDKCILCGLCVRICEEVAGATALGFIDRGFDTVIKPAFDADLRDTDCISCGQCVHVCPTGALTETMMIDKQVPLRENLTETVCAFCSVGCKTSLASTGSLLLRSLPASEKGAVLCMKGRFGFGEIRKAERLTIPLIRGNDGLKEATFEQAIACANDSLRNLRTKFGDDCVAVAISDRYTNEEAFIIKEYAEKALKTNKVFSFGQTDGGLADVLGRDASTSSLDEIEDAELIVAVLTPGSDMHRSVAAMRIRRAVRNGAKLLILSSNPDGEDGLLDEIAALRIDMGDELASLEQIIRVLLDNGCGGDVEGRDELSASLTVETIREEIRASADMIMKAGKTLFIFERHAITTQAARLVANIAVLSGHAENSGGIIQLLPGANSQGLINLGVGSGEDFLRTAADGIRGLFVFGEEIDGFDLSAIEFLAVQDMHMTEVARQADIVLPASSFAEIDGSFTACDNKTRILRPAVASPAAWDNITQIKALAAGAGVAMPYQSAADIRQAMSGKHMPDINGIRLAAAKKDTLCRLNYRATNKLNSNFTQFSTEHGLI